MLWWKSHVNAYAPAFAGAVKVALPPAGTLTSMPAEAMVNVCSTASAFFTVTVALALTVTAVKAKPEMSTVFADAGAALVDDALAFGALPYNPPPPDVDVYEPQPASSAALASSAVEATMFLMPLDTGVSVRSFNAARPSSTPRGI